ncbi:MAG: hypothetical protein GC161_06615 [Planctomycetaceae bacterium]|nr:hypothetical protein [Planctomycetaceae bacterium]
MRNATVLAVLAAFVWSAGTRAASDRSEPWLSVCDVGEGQTAAVPPFDLAHATWAQLAARVPGPTGETVLDPVTGQWVPHPVAAEIAFRLTRGDRPSDAEWVELLTQSGAVRYRETWPVDQPWTVSMRLPKWLGQARIELRPRSEGFEPAVAGGLVPEDCGSEWLFAVSRAARQELGDVALGEQPLVLDAEIVWGPTPYAVQFPHLPNPGSSILWTGPIHVPLRGVATLADALPPVRGAEVEAAVRRAIKLTPMDGLLHVEYAPADVPELRGLALALEVELHSGGELRERCQFHFQVPWVFQSIGFPESAKPILLSHRLSPETVARIRERSTWTVTVSGIEHPALLTNWNANRYFAGSYEFQAP